ncbi:MAG: 1-acyl-sn-glycerol-3-phosphate acyltransferase [Candidatus Wildermuthbacteria bacterium]|nr:1-acyl-sn-glycerol-3-phosphate acyltransferase [Candidatus Wildermuthbacteria bacterium]
MNAKKLKIMAFAWSVGIFGRLAVLVLQALGIVRVEGIRNLRALLARDEGFLVIHRHPSMRETVMIPLLFVPWALWNWKRVPVVTPDKHNYYDPWWCASLRPLAIPVLRENHDVMRGAALKMRRALLAGRPLVLAPEGGRTFKGENFKYLTSADQVYTCGRPEAGVDLSQCVIRRFQPKVGELCGNGKIRITVLPVWVDSKGWHTTIIFGKPTTLPLNTLDKTEALENLLLHTSRQRSR